VDVSAGAELRCAGCHAQLEPEDRFCERCGARLMTEIAERGPDRLELDLVVAAAVSDRGRVHRRNEDAFHLEASPAGGVAAVVCDGISSASAGNVAAQNAARAAGQALVEAADDPGRDARATMLDAIQAAQLAVGQVPWTTRADRGMPSCTLVSALCHQDEIVIGSVGDSRAYWIGSDGAEQITVDDSWAEEQASQGVLTFEQALQDPRSHAITHWIGADAPDRPPRIETLRLIGSGRLVLCTDGMWNYAASVPELEELIDALPTRASAAAVARSLTDMALARGGRDNITVAVMDIA
jgi:PPM family protein phosphatase